MIQIRTATLLVILAVARAVCCARPVVNASVGGNVTLPCQTALSYPVDWRYAEHDTARGEYIFVGGNRGMYWQHHNRTELTVTNVIGTNVTICNLTIYNLNMKDTGIYTCAENEGLGTKHPFLLNVSYARQVINTTVGDNVIFPCHTELDSSVDWKYKNDKLPKEINIFTAGKKVDYWQHYDRTELTSEAGDFNLILRSVTVSDTGAYTCIEDEGRGDVQPFLLHVYNPDRPVAPPSVSKAGLAIGVSVGLLVPLVVIIVVVILVLKRRKQAVVKRKAEERESMLQADRERDIQQKNRELEEEKNKAAEAERLNKEHIQQKDRELEEEKNKAAEAERLNKEHIQQKNRELEEEQNKAAEAERLSKEHIQQKNRELEEEQNKAAEVERLNKEHIEQKNRELEEEKNKAAEAERLNKEHIQQNNLELEEFKKKAAEMERLNRESNATSMEPHNGIHRLSYKLHQIVLIRSYCLFAKTPQNTDPRPDIQAFKTLSSVSRYFHFVLTVRRRSSERTFAEQLIARLLTVFKMFELAESESDDESESENLKIIHRDYAFEPELAAAGVKLVVVDFYTTWCGASQSIAPAVKKLAREYTKALFVMVDVDKCSKTANGYGVAGVPTFVFFRNRMKIDTLRGADSKVLEARIRKWYGTGDENEDETTVKGHMNLVSFIKNGDSECLNEVEDHVLAHALASQDSGYLESDCDEQLIIAISFEVVVKLHSLRIYGPKENGPKTVKLFINQPETLDFDSAESMKSVQTLRLTADDIQEGAIIELKFVRFQGVHKITLFVKDNQNGSAKTQVNYLRFIGSPRS